MIGLSEFIRNHIILMFAYRTFSNITHEAHQIPPPPQLTHPTSILEIFYSRIVQSEKEDEKRKTNSDKSQIK